MPDPGVLLSKSFAASLQDMVAAWEDGSFGPPRQPRPYRDTGARPPLRGILLEDLVDAGQADCAVTIYFSTTEIQQVTLLGGPVSTGTFTLKFTDPATGDTQTTTALQWNSTAAAVQKALEALSFIGKNNVEVTLGKGNYANLNRQNTGDNSTRSEYPGVWIVKFIGKFAGTNPPLLIPNSSVGGASPVVMVAETSHWGDTGRVETVRCVIPVGDPTPMKAGAVVGALFFNGAGYGVVAVEPRQFGSFY